MIQAISDDRVIAVQHKVFLSLHTTMQANGPIGRYIKKVRPIFLAMWIFSTAQTASFRFAYHKVGSWSFLSITGLGKGSPSTRVVGVISGFISDPGSEPRS